MSAPAFAEQNENGVYAETEVLALPHARKGWRGGGRAEVRLAYTPAGWRGTYGFAFTTGNHWGHSGPITDHDVPHASREEAIAEQVERLRTRISTVKDAAMQREAAEMLAWAESLNPAQRDMFEAA